MNRIIEIYIEQFEYDVAIMSQPWMYLCILIPILCYMCFFLVKWAVLTAPFWIPIAIVIKVWRGDDFTIDIGSSGGGGEGAGGGGEDDDEEDEEDPT
jgi:hypothetical protein